MNISRKLFVNKRTITLPSFTGRLSFSRYKRIISEDITGFYLEQSTNQLFVTIMNNQQSMLNKMLLLIVPNEVFLVRVIQLMLHIIHVLFVVGFYLLYKKIYYINDYKNDELVKPFCDELNVEIKQININ